MTHTVKFRKIIWITKNLWLMVIVARMTDPDPTNDHIMCFVPVMGT